MTLRRTAIGFLTAITLLVTGTGAASAESSMIDLILKQLEEENGVSDAIKLFASKVADEKLDLTEKDVEAAARYDTAALCGSKAADGGSLSATSCSTLSSRIMRVVERERGIRSLGRELQAIATSYELPIRDGQRGDVAVNTSVTGIISAWRVQSLDEDPAGTSTGLLLRAVSIDADRSKSAAEQIASAYDDVGSNDAEKEEQQRAMIWRYGAGVRLVRDERAGYRAPAEFKLSEPQLERQYLFKRWENVEGPLNNLWNMVKELEFDPPLKRGEVAIIQWKNDGLPENVQLWGFIERKATGEIDGDVGLQWGVPLDPVFPSLMKEGDGDGPILGGSYPPPPIETDSEDKSQDGRALCPGPIARRGYLCRPIEDIQSVECEEEAPDVDDAIVLSSCTEKDPERDQSWCCLPGATDAEGTCVALSEATCENRGGTHLGDVDACMDAGCPNIEHGPTVTTIAGPDVCADIQWTLAESVCKTVKVECGGPQPDISFDKIEKNGDTVNVTLYQQNSVPYRAALTHALTHVVQICGPSSTSYIEFGEDFSDLPNLPDYEQRIRNQACCRTEVEAFQWEYLQMEKEGLLQGLGPVGDIDINATTLAEASADQECRGFFPKADGCRTSFPQEAAPRLAGLVSGVGNDGKTCDEIIEEAEDDPMFRGMIAAATHNGDVCAPGASAQFPATIGNTMCLIGACAEHATELRRAVPGRIGFTMGDEAFPFDENLQPSIDAASFLTGIPDVKQVLPTYAPRQAIRNLDEELCQRAGLPPQSPATACTLTLARRLGLPLPSYSATTNSLFTDAVAQKDALNEYTSLSLAAGVRTGTALYVDVSGRFARSFAEILRLSFTLLDALRSTEFPTNMCPLGTP